MKLKEVLTKNEFSPEIIEIITAGGITDLFPPQAEAVKSGMLNGDNLLMSVPTAAGKTLLAEMCMVKSITQENGRCLYIAPLKALASEKYNDFKNKYESQGIKVGLAIGDADTPSHKLNTYQIIVATAEKVDSLLRTKAQWLINSLSVVVLDEIHFINDGSRGPTMEILTARIKQLNPNVQIIALSATVSNAGEMADWLDAKLVQSDWRPIPLKEGVYFNESIYFDEAPTRVIKEEAIDDVSKITLDTLRGKGQVLVFVSSRRSAQAVSRQVCHVTSKVLTPEEKQELLLLSKKISGNSSDSTKICRKLADCIVHGSAFHHAGLKPKQRELIEKNFKNNLIKVISCTPTLAAGVNLPARRAIVRDCKRFEVGLGSAYIPTSEYKQCAGRAGRPQYDDYGEAVLVAKTESETDTLFERYIHADPEPVISKLADESALRIHILASIAGGYVHDVKGMFDFISHTFLAHQNQEDNLLDLVSETFDFLHREEFIQKSGYRFFATPLGALTSRIYIDPISSIVLRDGITKLKSQPFTVVGMMHLATCCPDCPVSKNVPKGLVEELESFASHCYDDFIFRPDNWDELDDLYHYMATLKTTLLLNQWIEEEKEEILCDHFNVGPGDIYRHIEGTQWLLYAAGQIADLLRQKKLTFQIDDLRKRIRYGIKEELLEIAQLKGVGRIRARAFFDNGIKKLKDFNYTNADEISKIKPIGLTLARDIYKQLANPKFKRSTAKKQEAVAVETDEWED